jgi:hypothetical protein
MISCPIRLPVLVLSVALCLAAGVAAEDMQATTPQIVLDGTDIVALTDFDIASVSDDLSGKFGTETGGARQTLSVTRTGPETWHIERQISEPGAAPMVRSYDARRLDGVLRDAAKTFALRATVDGVLVLETAAGDEISGNYWTFYAAQ